MGRPTTGEFIEKPGRSRERGPHERLKIESVKGVQRGDARECLRKRSRHITKFVLWQIAWSRGEHGT